MTEDSPISALLRAARVVAVLTIERVEDAVPLARALVAGGVRTLEITLRTPAGADAAAAVRAAVPEAVVGLGTVLTRRDLELVQALDLAFAFSPGATPELLDAAAALGVPFVPGVATASELIAALARGFGTVKLFPAEQVGGVGALKALAGPFPAARFNPTGGVSEANMGAYLALTNVVAVGGSWLAPAAEVRAGAWPAITARARQTMSLAGALAAAWPPAVERSAGPGLRSAGTRGRLEGGTMTHSIQRRALLAAATVVAGGLRARAQTPVPVTIAIQYGVGYLPVMVADKLGLFAEQARASGTEVKVALTRMSGATAINDALISGSIDIGAYGLPGMLIAREKTLRNYGVRGLCSLSSLPYGLYTNVPGIRSVADIGPSDRIAVTAPNTPQAELLRMAAEKAFGDAHRLDPQMVSLPHPDATIALIGGRGATLYFATPPFSQTLDASANIHRVVTSKEILGEDITGAMLATTARFVARPGLAAAIVAALAAANRLIAADPARCAALYLDSEASKLTPAQVEAILREMGGLYATAPSGTMAMAAFMAKQGELKSPPARWQEAFYPPVNEGEGS